MQIPNINESYKRKNLLVPTGHVSLWAVASALPPPLPLHCPVFATALPTWFLLPRWSSNQLTQTNGTIVFNFEFFSKLKFELIDQVLRWTHNSHIINVSQNDNRNSIGPAYEHS